MHRLENISFLRENVSLFIPIKLDYPCEVKKNMISIKIYCLKYKS